MATDSKFHMQSRLKRVANLVISFVSSRYFLTIIVAWFILQSVFFALAIPFALPPDERDHLGFIELFINNHFSPFIHTQEGYYWLGESTRNPFYLYHYLLSFPYALVQNWEYGYILPRLINIGLGIVTLYLLVRIARQLHLSKLATNLGLAMLSCTLMFTFLFGAISYDNLFILLSILSAYLLLVFTKSGDFRHLALLLITLCAGLLVKVNFIPVACIVGLVLVVFFVRRFRQTLKNIAKSFRSHLLASALLILLLLPVVGLLIERHGVNLIEYRTYAPSCTQVLTLEQCRENPLFVRNEKIYETDRRDASKNFIEYTINWLGLIGERTYGIFAHKQLLPYKILLVGIFVIWLIGIIAVMRRLKVANHSLTILFVSLLLYVLAVLLQNFNIYLESGRESFAVHGRYLFAALPLLYLVLAESVTRLTDKTRILQASGILLILLLFLAASLPSFLLQAPPEWYSWSN